MIKPRTYQNNDLNYVPFGTTAKHMIKEMKRGTIMANYNGFFKKYNSIRIVKFTKSKFKKIPGSRFLNHIAYIIAQEYDKL